MKISWFHLMPYRYLPSDFEDNYRSVWVDVPSDLYDSERGHELYNEYLDELEHADSVGFDGICINEHHNNAYGIMPSPNITAAALTRRTSDAAIIVLGNSLAFSSNVEPPVNQTGSWGTNWSNRLNVSDIFKTGLSTFMIDNSYSTLAP